MKKWFVLMLGLLFVLMLGACAKEPAAYLISGSDISLTIERIKPNFWTKGWELDAIARQNPNCQRRHHLKPTKNDKFKVYVYTPERGVFILQQGKRWYVTNLRTCDLDTFKEPPPEPGELVGTFMEKEGSFQFVENKDRPAADEGAADND